jgi:hypothetical protein
MRILSLDQLLEESLGNVYRAWYTLPRRSTLPELDKLRTKLANELDALSRPVDLTLYEKAQIDFAAAVRGLPGVADVGGTVLADLAEAVPTEQRVGFGPLLRKTDASPERLSALVALLRVENPPQAVIAAMTYAPDQADAVWHTVWSALEPRIEEMPAAERSLVEAIGIQCDAAVVAAATPMQRQQAYLQGLQALEKVPAVIRVAWQSILANKHIGEAPTYLHGSIDPFDLEYAAPPTADVPLAMTAAAAPAPAPDKETEVSFFTDVRFPERVKRAGVQWLTVQLTLESVAESIAAATVSVRFGPTKENELPPPEFVEVRLVAPGFSEVTGGWERTMTVYPQRDSQPVVFLLTSDKLGPKRVSIDFVHKGRMIASVAFKCEVVEGSTSRANQKIELEEKPEVAPLAANPPPAADLVLRVVRTAEANGLSFVLSSSLPELPFHSQPLGQIKLTEKDPQAFFTNRLQRLSDLAAAIPGSTSDGRMVKEIESLGEGLFELLMPPELQAAYWGQIKPLIDKGRVKTLLIVSDEPWIPWELIKPYLWNDASNSDEKADFLVEQVVLSRWLARPLPAELAVTTAALVAPDVNLGNVQIETTFFLELAQQHTFGLQGPLDERDEVIDRLRDGDFQILHFATHGSFNESNADQSELTLADGSLTPADLMGGDLRGIRMGRPLVFLNACHSGQVALGLTCLGGWADKFFREARASAFIGTLWEVSDDLAAEFTRKFYTELAGGKTLGEALREARLHIREKEQANPTWLAYALYGDPNGKVTFG